MKLVLNIIKLTEGYMKSEQPLHAFDVDTLINFVDDDETTALYFLERFFLSLTKSMAELKKVVYVQNYRDAARVAHKMLTSANAIGATSFSLRCALMEKYALARDEKKCVSILSEMERILAQLQESANVLFQQQK